MANTLGYVPQQSLPWDVDVVVVGWKDGQRDDG